jgi:hypothetical protein
MTYRVVYGMVHDVPVTTMFNRVVYRVPYLGERGGGRQ